MRYILFMSPLEYFGSLKCSRLVGVPITGCLGDQQGYRELVYWMGEGGMEFFSRFSQF